MHSEWGRMAEAHDHQELSRGLVRPLVLAMAVIGAFMVVELVGGLLSGSLALMSDAGHMLTDTLALALSLAAVRVALRPPTEEQTFGYHRAEILAALVNGSTLIVISMLIFYEAALRLLAPPEVNSTLMLAVAVAGLVANAVAASLLRDRSRQDLNARGVYLHIMGDLLSSIGVIVGAVLMLAFGWWLADPVISVLIGVIILAGAWKLVTQSTHILLESVPAHMTLEEVREGLKAIEGVGEVHDLHVWTVSSGLYALSAHVVVRDARVSDYGTMMARCREMLRERFGISHTTIQIECEGCETPFCALARQVDEDRR
jgi:cobalt-zinc-cadmium efflux system protein